MPRGSGTGPVVAGRPTTTARGRVDGPLILRGRATVLGLPCLRIGRERGAGERDRNQHHEHSGPDVDGLPEPRGDEGPEHELMETYIVSEVEKGAKLPGLYPMNDESKARYEAWKKSR